MLFVFVLQKGPDKIPAPFLCRAAIGFISAGTIRRV
jgi:hypothetical protein